MFIIERNGEIIIACETKEEVESSFLFEPELENEEIIETSRPIAEIDGKFVYADTAEYKEAKNAEIAKVRGNLYAETIDPLHAEKQRKTVLGTWTETDESEYVEQVKALSAKIQEENPYF